MLLRMSDGEDVDRITIWGEAAESGAYLLRIRIERPLTVAFGRYRGGRPIPVPAGHVVYVGSAMGRQGSTTLAHRLLRHATRSRKRPAHPIRASLLRRFRRARMGPDDLRPPTAKRLHWHVDYLLDEPTATIDALLILRSSHRRESALARLVASSSHTTELARGLGATDAARRTHLLRLYGGASAWRDLLRTIRADVLNRENNGESGSEDQ